MPLYVYKCDTCDQVVEELQKHDDPPPEPECPQGGTCEMKKQMTAAGLKFLGDGWGGNELQADGNTIVRTIKGKNTTKYGEGSV